MSRKRKTPEIFMKRDNKILNNTIIRNIYDIINDEDKFSKIILEQDPRWDRINYCEAWESSEIWFDICGEYYKVWLIKSYGTIVGIFMEQFDSLIIFGRYSMTTYQHISKFRNNHRLIITSEYNMEFENWF